jgi:hypothetical protein
MSNIAAFSKFINALYNALYLSLSHPIVYRIATAKKTIVPRTINASIANSSAVNS